MNLKVKKKYRKAPKVKFPLPEFKNEILDKQQLKFLKYYGRNNQKIKQVWKSPYL